MSREEFEKLKKLEDVLGCELLQVEVELIRIDWRAFYVSPEAYKNTVVPNLVKEYLGI